MRAILRTRQQTGAAPEKRILKPQQQVTYVTCSSPVQIAGCVNFCLFAHRTVAGQSQLLADVFQLFGLVSRFSAPELIAPPEDVCACTTGIPGEGMDLAKAAFSPWDDGGLIPPHVPDALQTESFRSAWRLVDERGRLPRSLDPDALGDPGDYQIVVAAFPGRKVSAAALPLSGRCA